MKGSLVEALYSESSNLSKVELDSTSTSSAQNKVANFQDAERDHSLNENDAFWDGSDQELENSSDLNREWQQRREQFHTARTSIGYHDGLIAGKEAAAQDGFNMGFKQSISVGCRWGIVTGVTSATAFLPDGLKEILIGTEERRTEFQKLYESAHSLLTADALKLFNDSIGAKEMTEKGENAETGSYEGDLHQQRSGKKQLESYYGQLDSLLESPQITIWLSEANRVPSFL